MYLDISIPGALFRLELLFTFLVVDVARQMI